MQTFKLLPGLALLCLIGCHPVGEIYRSEAATPPDLINQPINLAVWAEDGQSLIYSLGSQLVSYQLSNKLKTPLLNSDEHLYHSPSLAGQKLLVLEAPLVENPNLLIYDLKQRKLLKRLPAVTTYSLSPDRKTAWILHRNGLYHLNLGTLNWQKQRSFPKGFMGNPPLLATDAHTVLMAPLTEDIYEWENHVPLYAVYPQLWQLNLQTRRDRRLYKQMGMSSDYSLERLSRSPDGRYLTFISGVDQQLRLLDFESGQIKPLLRGWFSYELSSHLPRDPKGVTEAPTWIDNQRVIFTQCEALPKGCRSWLFNTQSDQLHPLSQFKGLQHLSFSPRNRHLAAWRHQKNQWHLSIQETKGFKL